MLKLAPKMAHRLRADGPDEKIALELVWSAIASGCGPGDGVPVDAEVVEGQVTVDESMVIDESMPATKHIGDKLVGGTLNATSPFVMRAEKVGVDTMLARIVAMVSEAQRSRAPIQRLAAGSPSRSSSAPDTALARPSAGTRQRRTQSTPL